MAFFSNLASRDKSSQRLGITFGRQGPEVQILSLRPAQPFEILSVIFLTVGRLKWQRGAERRRNWQLSLARFCHAAWWRFRFVPRFEFGDQLRKFRVD
jgi:hypothetical protein